MADVPDSEVVHRTLDVTSDDPAIEVAEVVADLEGCDVIDLTATYDVIDHLLDNVFESPPAADAQVEITFTYEGYRITVEQNGHAKFVTVA